MRSASAGADFAARKAPAWRSRSPEQISVMLRREFPEQPEMWVSHETIYQELYVQGRGELRRELTRCLRTGRCAARGGCPTSGATAGSRRRS